MEDHPYKTQGEADENGGDFWGEGSLSFVVGVFAEDDKALQDGSDGEVLFCGQLGPLSVGQQHRRGVGLETCDGLGLACLAHDIHRLWTHHNNKLMRKEIPFFPPAVLTYFSLLEIIKKKPKYTIIVIVVEFTCPTLTDTGSGRSSSSKVTSMRGCMAATRP